jgi:hypothetical protein
MVVAATRYLFGAFLTSKRAMAVFAFACLPVTVFTYEGLLSILSCGASLIQTTAAFCRNDKILRQTMIIGTVVWITHNVLAESPGAVLLESLFLCSNLAGYYRYYIRRKKPVQTH